MLLPNNRHNFEPHCERSSTHMQESSPATKNFNLWETCAEAWSTAYKLLDQSPHSWKVGRIHHEVADGVLPPTVHNQKNCRNFAKKTISKSWDQMQEGPIRKENAARCPSELCRKLLNSSAGDITGQKWRTPFDLPWWNQLHEKITQTPRMVGQKQQPGCWSKRGLCWIPISNRFDDGVKGHQPDYDLWTGDKQCRLLPLPQETSRSIW